MYKVVVIDKDNQMVFYEASAVFLDHKKEDDESLWKFNADLIDSFPKLIASENDQIQELGFENKELRLSGKLISPSSIKKNDRLRVVVLDERKEAITEFTYFAKHDEDLSVVNDDLKGSAKVYLLHRDIIGS